MMILTLVQLQEAKQTGPDPDKFSSTQILNPPKKVKLGIHRKLQKERALGLFLSTGLNIKDMVSQGLSVLGFENQ